jgi:hypothetical protein
MMGTAATFGVHPMKAQVEPNSVDVLLVFAAGPPAWICLPEANSAPTEGARGERRTELLCEVLMVDRASDSERIDHQPAGEHCEHAAQEYNDGRQAPPKGGACSGMT